MNKHLALLALIVTTSCVGMRQHPAIEAALQTKLQQIMNDTKEIRWELEAHLVKILGYSEEEAIQEIHRLLKHPNPHAQLLAELAQKSKKDLDKLPKYPDESGMLGPSPLEAQARITKLLNTASYDLTIDQVNFYKSKLTINEIVKKNRAAFNINVAEAALLIFDEGKQELDIPSYVFDFYDPTQNKAHLLKRILEYAMEHDTESIASWLLNPNNPYSRNVKIFDIILACRNNEKATLWLIDFQTNPRASQITGEMLGQLLLATYPNLQLVYTLTAHSRFRKIPVSFLSNCKKSLESELQFRRCVFRSPHGKHLEEIKIIQSILRNLEGLEK